MNKLLIHIKGNSLALLSCIYFLLPVILFFTLGLKSVFSIILLILFLFYFIYLVRNKSYKQIVIKHLFTTKKSFIIFAIAILTIFLGLLFSGCGNFAPQNSDYFKHNAIISTLIYNKGPIKLTESSGTYYLIYYIAYYLVPVFIEKIILAMFINASTIMYITTSALFFVGTFLGLLLAYMGICKIYEKIVIGPLIILIMFSGMKILGYTLVYKHFPEFGFPLDYGIGNKIIEYPSFTSELYWAPQIFITALIPTLMLFYYIKNKQCNYSTYIVVSCTILGCPFITVGILPIFIYYIYNLFKNNRSIKDIILHPSVLLSLYIITFTTLYMVSNSQSVNIAGFIGNFVDFNKFGIGIFIFILIEVGVFTIPILILKTKLKNISLFYICLIFIHLLSLIYIGLYNDFAMRTTLPSLIIIYLFVCNVLQVSFHNIKHAKMKILSIYLITVLIVGSAAPVFEIFRGITGIYNINEPITYNISVFDLGEIQNQYIINNENGFYQKGLVK